MRRYKALIDVVNRLAEERKLKFQPTFLYPIVSSLGYMNADMNVLLKEIGKCFKFHQSKARRSDGLLEDGSRRNWKTVCASLWLGETCFLSAIKDLTD